jgi:hypothetical protein
MRMFISHVVDHHPDADDKNVTVSEKTAEAEAFFQSLVKQLPQLNALDKVKDVKKPDVTPGHFREKRGGDLALRGVGMAIFARAYLYSRKRDIDFDAMAARLAMIDWHLLTCERDQLPKHTASYAQAVQAAAVPTWGHLIAVTETGYRVRSSSEDADAAWGKIEAQLFAAEHSKVAPRSELASLTE